MKRKQWAYWTCQACGWTFYTLTFMFFAWIYDHKISSIFLERLLISVVSGLLLTHLLRFIVLKLHLLPPIFGKQWLYLFSITLSICVIYSFVTSSLVEWFKLYLDVPTSLQLRFFLNLLNDSPIIIVWLSIYYLWHYIKNSRKLAIDQVRMESLVKDLELKTIKSHINPHFIFNALNSIRALVDENPERARKAITELSNILRSSMLAEKTESSPLKKELGIVKDYLALEQIRFEDRLRVSYDIDEETLNQFIPPMMLQTLVENAIKHGVSKQVDGGAIKITSCFDANYHQLIVENTGSLNGALNAEGFGIKSTIDRLGLLYGDKAQFEIKNVNKQTVQARIAFPISVSSNLTTIK